MEGYEIHECIAEQKRINRIYYEKERKEKDQQWYTQGAPLAKAAHTEEVSEEKVAETNEDNDEQAQTEGLLTRWYGINSQ